MNNEILKKFKNEYNPSLKKDSYLLDEQLNLLKQDYEAEEMSDEEYMNRQNK